MTTITLDTVLRGLITVTIPDLTQSSQSQSQSQNSAESSSSQNITVQQLKSLIQQQHGYDSRLQTIVHCGKILADTHEISSNQQQNQSQQNQQNQQHEKVYILLMRLNQFKNEYLTMGQIEEQARIQAELKRVQQEAAEKKILAEKQRLLRQQQEEAQRREQQQRQEQARRALEQVTLPSMDQLPVDDNLVATLIEMGFSPFAAKKALLLGRLDVNMAAEYLFSHMGDPSLEAPLTRQQTMRIIQAYPQFQHHWQSVQQQLQQAGVTLPTMGQEQQQQQQQPQSPWRQ